MKRQLLNNLKNIYGWRTPRKLIVFSVDDYGNVRLDSRQAREKMDRAGLKVRNRFDAYDALETREDLEMLYEVLYSVRDKNNRPAVFTPFSLPCNIDFERMIEEKRNAYSAELLPRTFSKLAARHPKAYQGAWALWQEGIAQGVMAPQSHGREHLNIKVLEEKLGIRDKEVLTALHNRSYTSLSGSGYPTISYTAAFQFWDFTETKHHNEIIKEGLSAFRRVFGLNAVHFNPPGGRENEVIHQTLHDHGIRYLDSVLFHREHQGKGKYKFNFNWTGKRNPLKMTYQVRNVVFEPTDPRGFDWVGYSLKQIEAAFYWNRPAIISSHRVNFCGHIDPENRRRGLGDLSLLLSHIVRRWPEVEFVSSAELGAIIDRSRVPTSL